MSNERSIDTDCGARHEGSASLDAAMGLYAGGDAEAFSLIHRALRPRLRAFFVRKRRCLHAADDLVQETFLRLHRARTTFAPGARALPWVYAIARNVLIDHARAAKLREARPIASEPVTELPDTAANAEAVLSAAETARAADEVLRRLPASQREAFVLLRFEGRSLEDIARSLGITATAAKLRAFRASEAIRGELGVAAR